MSVKRWTNGPVKLPLRERRVEPPSVAIALDIIEVVCAVWYESSDVIEKTESAPRGSSCELETIAEYEVVGEAACLVAGETKLGVSFGLGDARIVRIEDNDGG